MAGEFSENSSGSGTGEGCMRMLKELKREEILEVISKGFCEHCEAILENRIHNLLKRKLNDSECLTGFSSEDASSHKQHSATYSHTEIMLNDGLSEVSSVAFNESNEEQKERVRFSQVGRKKDFFHIERINGKQINVLQGLELHTGVFNSEEQKNVVDYVYNLQRMGQKGQLKERTYSEPRKWMRGKGRVTIQFGCCYNYAVDKNGNPPGIIRAEEVDPLPPLFRKMIKRMVRWHILPPTCVPNSCIVNLYDEGDCIPPHIDHHDFVRPFCTVSFLTECNILFGSNLKIVGPGEFWGPVSIPLPVGSVLILKGNGADVAKHCVPAVPAKRISITFRRMDDSKLPYKFSSDPELIGIKPQSFSPVTKSPSGQQNQPQKPNVYSPKTKSSVHQNQLRNGTHADDSKSETRKTDHTNSFFVERDDFPPLGRSSPQNRLTPWVNRPRRQQHPDHY